MRQEAALKDNPGPADLLFKRLGQRTTDQDGPSSLATRDAQLTAMSDWGIPDKSQLVWLAALFQPVLVADGGSDILMPPRTPTCWPSTSPTPS